MGRGHGCAFGDRAKLFGDVFPQVTCALRGLLQSDRTNQFPEKADILVL